MTQDTEDVVALRHELALISLEYAAKGLEREAGRVMRAINLIEQQAADRQSLSDRIDVLLDVLELLEATAAEYRLDPGQPAKATDLALAQAAARAALHQEGIAP